MCPQQTQDVQGMLGYAGIDQTQNNMAVAEIPGKLNIFFKFRKEGNVLFNDALNTFYLRLYGVRHMVKDHTNGEE